MEKKKNNNKKNENKNEIGARPVSEMQSGKGGLAFAAARHVEQPPCCYPEAPCHVLSVFAFLVPCMYAHVECVLF